MRLSSKFAESWLLAARQRSLVVLVLLVVLLGGYAFAQEATVLGTVTDPAAAVLANATVTITNTETGLSRTLTTNADGQYIAPDLRIGRYTIRAEAKGFKTAERKDLLLQVGDRARVDFTMQVGTAQETVTVEAATVAVQTDTGEVSSVITGQQITQLQSNGRNIYSLVALAPGASSSQSDFIIPVAVGGDSNVSFNGQRPGHNIYLMDGGENLDRGGSGNMSIMPSLEAVAEFRVLASNYSADYGLSSSATMTTVSKSGTSTLHGSAWWFGRNDAFDARNWFNPRENPGGSLNKVAKLRFNTYGFNLGGPIDFARKEHKSFFFFNMEWRKLIQGQTLTTNVPATSEYPNGAAADCFDGVAGCAILTSTATVPTNVPVSTLFANCPGGVAPEGVTPGSPFPSNTIPDCMVDANARSLLLDGHIFPAPTSGGQFLGGASAPTNVREEIVRVDHRFNDKFSVFGHFVAEQISQTFGTSMWSGDNVPTVGNTFNNPSYSAVAHVIHTISPTLLNEIAFNYNGNRINIIPKAAFGATLSAPPSFTFNRIFTGPNASDRMPSINLNNLNTNYTVNWMPWVNRADDYQIRDDISWTRGAHQFKIGGSWAIYKKIQDVFASTQGSFGFNGFFSGNDYADMVLGYANSYSENAVHDNGHWNNVSWAAYFQDNWRATRRLTLNLGLRWDGVPHTYEAVHRSSNFYPEMYDQNAKATFDDNGNICSGATNGCTAASPGLGTSPNAILAGYQFYLNGIGIDGKTVQKGLVNAQWKSFGPRLGFAYDVTGQGKTVVRGGFGIMYERIQGNDMYDGGNNPPFAATANFSSVSLSDPHLNVTSGNVNTVPIIVSNITGISKNNYKNPTSAQYSIGVQQSLGQKSVLSISYVGNQNRHLNDRPETNLPDPAELPDLITSGGAGYNQLVPYLGYRSITMSTNEANSHYNSLQFDLNSNIRDISLRAGYTLSRAIDPSTGGSGADLYNTSNPYAGWRYDVGPGNYDRTHVVYANFVYRLPFFKNSSSRMTKAVLGGWDIAGVISMQSGAPFNVTLGGNQGSNGVQNATNRPDFTGSVHYIKKVQLPTETIPRGMLWIDNTGMSLPALGEWGNMKHNLFRGPGRDNWNLSVHKTFAFTERAGLEMRVEAFNVWNHTQFRANAIQGGIGNNFSGSNFGLITSAHDPRVLQLAMKLFF